MKKAKKAPQRRKVEPINFMGMNGPVRRARPKTRPAPKINFINMKNKAAPKNSKYNKAPLSNLNMVNVPAKMFNLSPNRKRPVRKQVPFSMIIKKESISQKRALSKWGDADMDGTVNFLDCSPRQVSNDGFFGDAWSAVKKVFGGEDPDSKAKDIAQAKKKQVYQTAKYDLDSKYVPEKDIMTPIEKIVHDSNLRERVKEKKEETRLILEAQGIKMTAEDKRVVSSQVRKKDAEELKQSQAEKDSVGASAFKKRQDAKKVDMDLEAALLKAKNTRAENVRGRVRASIQPVVQPLQALNSRLNEGGSFSKSSMEGQRQFGRKLINTVSVVVPGPLPRERVVYGSKKSKNTGTKRPVGRPKGSYKHSIPGKGLVSGDDYDEWERIQKLRGGQVGVVGGPKPIRQEREQVISQDNPVAKHQQERQVAVEQAQSGAVSMPQKGLSRDPYKAAIQQRQMQDQANDSVLNVEKLEAPNIMKGEMVDSADEDNILNAPNINQGGMRNVTGQESVGIELGERPQTNPHGDEYLEIEPGSGNAYIKRRINEKWATGEAL